jgi:hypothetical protein
VNILALESAVSDALNSAQVKQPTPVDAIVLVLSNDEYIMKICNFMATHYPQVKMIIRLLPSSKLRLADNDITEQDAIDNWLLPHAVNVVHPALSTPHLMAEMMLDPHYDENAEGFFSKHAELTLAKKIAAGIFGSVQQLKNGGVYGMQELHNAFSPKHQTNALNTEVDGAAVDETKQNSMNEENSDSE